MRVDDDVIQREAVIGPLKFDTIDGRAGKASRLGMSKHREEVVCADLALEPGSRPDPSKLGSNRSNFPRQFHHVHDTGKVEPVPQGSEPARTPPRSPSAL